MPDAEGSPGMQFALPDLGEGLTEATIVEWLVGVGETIKVDQPVVEVETAKARVEIPAPFVAMMSVMPMWPKLKRVAHTLPYDHALLGDTAAGHDSPLPRWSQSETPTLVMGGGKSSDWMQQAQVAIAEAIPGAEHRTIAGQTHMLKPDVIAPVLREYFR